MPSGLLSLRRHWGSARTVRGPECEGSCLVAMVAGGMEERAGWGLAWREGEGPPVPLLPVFT